MNALPRPARGWSVLGKRLRWFGATFFALELFYLVAGNLFLTFGLARVANVTPEIMKMEVEGAFSLWPGTAHVRRYRMRAQDRHIQWSLDVEDVDVSVDLLDLFRRKFHATRVRAGACSFRLRRKMNDEEAMSPRAQVLAPIAGFADPPLLPIGPPEAPPTDADYRLWIAQLEDVVVGVREIWIDEWRLLGPAEVRGGFYFKPDRRVEVGPAELTVRSGEFRIAERSTLRQLSASIASMVAPIDVQGPLASAVRQISVSGWIDARIPDVDFLRLYLGPDSPVKLEGGGGAVHVDVRLSHGQVMPATAIRVKSDRLAVTTPELDAALDLVAEARVLASAAGPTASGELWVRHATLGRPGTGVALAQIDRAVAHFRGLPRDLAGSFSIEHTHLDASAVVPDVGALLPPPEMGRKAPLRAFGHGAVRAEADLDRAFRAAGAIEVRSDRIALSIPALEASFALSAQVGFDGADFGERHLHLLPSHVVADDLTITRDGHAHRGGSVRVDLTKGHLRAGVARDVELVLAAQLADLRWLTFSAGGAKGGGVSVHAGEVRATLVIPRPAALFDGSPDEAALSGSMRASVSGESRLGDLVVRGVVRATTVIESLDLGRRALRLRQSRILAQDVEIERGTARSPGWWGTLDLSRLDLTAAGPVDLGAHVEVRCKNGAPFLAVLASEGTLPGWVGSIFPMNDLVASGDAQRRRGVTDLHLMVTSTSARVNARLHDLGSAMDGAVYVDTAVVSVGIALRHGQSHVQVFAGQAWLNAQMAAMKREELTVPGR